MSGVVDTGGDAQVEKSVKRMSQKSYHALLAAEGMLNATVDMEIEAGLDMELDHLREVFLHPDALEGMKSLLEGRRPEFEAVTA